jgi:hypothetical protein
MSRLGTPWRIAALLLGASELISATTQYCPLNAFLRVDSNREKGSVTSQEVAAAQPLADPSTAI